MLVQASPMVLLFVAGVSGMSEAKGPVSGWWRAGRYRVAFLALVFINRHPQVSKSDEASRDGSGVGRFACYPGCAVWLRDGRLAGLGCTRGVSYGGIGSVGRPGRSGGRVGWSA